MPKKGVKLARATRQVRCDHATDCARLIVLFHLLVRFEQVREKVQASILVTHMLCADVYRPYRSRRLWCPQQYLQAKPRAVSKARPSRLASGWIK
jgi:hypothetical protein